MGCILASRSVGRKQAMVGVALLSALFIPWLLPKMHERYYFLADVLAFALALGIGNPTTRGIAVGVQCVSLAALFSYVTDWAVPGMAGSVVATFVMIEIYRQARPARPDVVAKPLLRPGMGAGTPAGSAR